MKNRPVRVSAKQDGSRNERGIPLSVTISDNVPCQRIGCVDCDVF